MTKSFVITILFLIGISTLSAADKHLFVLSGQSNMKYLDPKISFVPTLEAVFRKRNIIVAHDAHGGQPIRRWYKNWTSAEGEKPTVTGNLYVRLMRKLKPILKRNKFTSVSFVWMQGEADAKEKHGDVYAESLKGLVSQLQKDIGRKNINVIIGRLSDCDLTNKHFPHWTKIRNIQVDFAEKYKRGAWVNTDDLNDGKNKQGRQIKNNLHYSVEGYKKLGQRFAEKSIELIRKFDK